MTVATENLLREMVSVAVAECEPDAIILFGSYAAGTAVSDSDVDLLVIPAEPFDTRDRRSEMVRLWRGLARFPVAKDILVFSRDEVERWRDSQNHIVARALREGRVLHGSL